MREFSRGPIWTNRAAREKYTPRIVLAQQTWDTLERESVASRLRRAALVIVPTSEMAAVSRWCVRSAVSMSVVEEQPGNRVRLLLSVDGVDDLFLNAWDARDDRVVGRILGFPGCCVDAFDEIWNKKNLRDPTISQAAGATEVDAPHPGTSMALRWFGIRLVPHLPCSHTCEKTIEQAEKFLQLGRSLKLDDGIAAILEMLCWPSTYSALHGLGVVQTPAFKFDFNTDYTPAEVKILRRSCKYEFVAPSVQLPTSWEDNGFSSKEAMRAAHTVVCAAASYLGGTVVDLGCGDGALLDRLRRSDNVSMIGVEMDAERCARGEKRHPGVVVLTSRIEDWIEALHPSHHVIFMPGRLTEMSEETAAFVREQLLLRNGSTLVLYAYGDWLRNGGLAELCQRVGLPVPTHIVKGDGVEAGAVR